MSAIASEAAMLQIMKSARIILPEPYEENIASAASEPAVSESSAPTRMMKKCFVATMLAKPAANSAMLNRKI